MTLMTTEIYEAFKAAKVSEETAKNAATAFGSIEARQKVMQWMIGFNLAISVAILFKLFS